MAYQPKMTHEERRARRREMAQFAKENGVAATVQVFRVSDNTVRSACYEYAVTPPRSNPPTLGPSALRVLVLLMHGNKPADIAAEFGFTRQYVCDLRKRAVAEGFHFPDC